MAIRSLHMTARKYQQLLIEHHTGAPCLRDEARGAIDARSQPEHHLSRRQPRWEANPRKLVILGVGC
jgi:hypothetical protein